MVGIKFLIDRGKAAANFFSCLFISSFLWKISNRSRRLSNQLRCSWMGSNLDSNSLPFLYLSPALLGDPNRFTPCFLAEIWATSAAGSTSAFTISTGRWAALDLLLPIEFLNFFRVLMLLCTKEFHASLRAGGRMEENSSGLVNSRGSGSQWSMIYEPLADWVNFSETWNLMDRSSWLWSEGIEWREHTDRKYCKSIAISMVSQHSLFTSLTSWRGVRRKVLSISPDVLPCFGYSFWKLLRNFRLRFGYRICLFHSTWFRR